jgi:limonene-1,2-epoxide hydrolase
MIHCADRLEMRQYAAHGRRVEGVARDQSTVTGSLSDAALDAMIRDFFLAWERRDVDQVMSRFTEDAVYHNISLKPLVGKAAIRAFLETFADVRPGRFEIRHQVAADGVVMNERIDHITLGGREVALPICGVFETESGLIKAWREYYDSAPWATS